MLKGPDAGRGQIMVAAALIIATILVGLALVLNSGIYAENLSSRETTDASDASAYFVGADDTVADAYRMANAADATTADDAAATFNATVDAWADRKAKEAAAEGAAVDIDRRPHVGWRLDQPDDRPFTPADDDNATGWQVATGAESVGAYELNVTRASLYDAGSNFADTSEEAFHLRVDDGTDQWLLYVFRDTSDGSIVVHRGDPDDFADLSGLRSDARTCTRSESRAVVDFRAETLAGTDCPALSFADGLDGPVDVHYENVRASADGEFRVEGQYAAVLNGSTAIATDAADEPARFNVTGGEPPTAQAVVYAASYTTHYEQSEIRHVRNGSHMVREESYAG